MRTLLRLSHGAARHFSPPAGLYITHIFFDRLFNSPVEPFGGGDCGENLHDLSVEVFFVDVRLITLL
jgi:hypothetical protein